MAADPTDHSIDISSSFFKLPPELRTEIYIQLIIDTREWLSIKRGLTFCSNARAIARKPSSGQLLRSCKVVYDEFLPVLYGPSTPAIFSVNKLQHGLQSIGSCAQNQLRHLRLYYRKRSGRTTEPIDMYADIEMGTWIAGLPFGTFPTLPKLNSLQQVILTCDIHWTKNALLGYTYDIFQSAYRPHEIFLHALNGKKVGGQHGLSVVMNAVGRSSNVEWALDLHSLESVQVGSPKIWTSAHAGVKIVEDEAGLQRWDIQRL